MKKPWEETWACDGVSVGALKPNERSAHLVCDMSEACIQDDGDRKNDGRFIAEAPAMWRLLATLGGSRIMGEKCVACGGNDGGTDEFGVHAHDCEWLRIARAIGYRP